MVDGRDGMRGMSFFFLLFFALVRRSENVYSQETLSRNRR
jgi:hypothetical protein